MEHQSDISKDVVLSVVVPLGRMRERGERCLKAILEQELDGPLEVIVVDARPHLGPLPSFGEPNVVHLPMPYCESYSAMKLEGIRRARSEYVAVVEDHAFVQPGWAAGVLRGFAQNDKNEVVVYTYLDATPHSYWSRSFMLLTYGRWMSEKTAGPRTFGAGNNVAYRKSALERQGERLDTLMPTELFLHRELRKQGGIVYQEASAKLAHSNWYDLYGTLNDTCSCSHLFARNRIEIEKSPLWKRLAYALAMPIVPPLLFYRYIRDMAPDRRLLWRFIRNAPALSVYMTCTAFFEALGYLGNRKRLKWHNDVEINVPRACDSRDIPWREPMAPQANPGAGASA